MSDEGNALFAVVLAAGRSQRFGSSKQLAEFHGQALIQRALVSAGAVCGSRCVVVLGANWLEIARCIEPVGGFLVYNARHHRGIGESIACGTRAVRAGAAAVLLMLVDQPLVPVTHLTELIDRWREQPDAIVASEFAETIGPPAIFPAALFGELEALSGDTGARSVIARHREQLLRVACEHGAQDVDTRDDLERLVSATAAEGN